MKKKLVLMTSALMTIGLLAGCGAHSHDYKLVEEVAATCTESGVRAHYTCSGCDKLFDEDKKETTLEALTIAALGHDYQFDSFVWADDYSAEAKHVCSRDNKHVEMREATVTSKVTKEATCEQDGVETYTATYGTHTETKEKVLSKLGHAYGDPTYVWSDDNKSCTATVICGNDSSHTIVETVESTYKELEAATEEADGKGKYTATFENEKFKTQEKEVVIESLPTLSKLTFTSNGDGTYSVKCKDSYETTGRIKIPSTYGEDEAEGIVTTLPNQAFFSVPNITEVFIPNTIKTIGSDGFYDCEKLTDVHFAENSVLESLGDCCFQACVSLVSVTFPKSVKTLGNRVFDECDNLESVVFEEGNELESIGTGCFSGCPKLKTIKFAETSKFTQINHFTFQELGALEELDLPNSLESMGNYSIYNCSSLKTLWLSKGLKSMETYSIDTCPIENLYFKGTMEEWNNVNKEYNCFYHISASVVHCTDGDVAI
jgi:hypothetical protein